MKNKLMFAINAYFYGVMIGSMFTWMHVIGIAKQQDWVIFMDFNAYGEGMFEYIMVSLWLLVALIKLITWAYDWVMEDRAKLVQEL